MVHLTLAFAVLLTAVVLKPGVIGLFAVFDWHHWQTSMFVGDLMVIPAVVIAQLRMRPAQLKQRLPARMPGLPVLVAGVWISMRSGASRTSAYGRSR